VIACSYSIFDFIIEQRRGVIHYTRLHRSLLTKVSVALKERIVMGQRKHCQSERKQKELHLLAHEFSGVLLYIESSSKTQFLNSEE